MCPCFSYPLPVYQPAMRVISAITNSFPAQVTTTINHQYITGTICRLIIPPGVGMEQANKLSAPIIVTGLTTFLILIDTTYFDAFIIPMVAPSAYTCAQVIPTGEISSILTAATVNVLPY